MKRKPKLEGNSEYLRTLESLKVRYKNLVLVATYASEGTFDPHCRQYAFQAVLNELLKNGA